jgi:hypothetical protein
MGDKTTVGHKKVVECSSWMSVILALLSAGGGSQGPTDGPPLHRKTALSFPRQTATSSHKRAQARPNMHRRTDKTGTDGAPRHMKAQTHRNGRTPSLAHRPKAQMRQTRAYGHKATQMDTDGHRGQVRVSHDEHVETTYVLIAYQNFGTIR